MSAATDDGDAPSTQTAVYFGKYEGKAYETKEEPIPSKDHVRKGHVLVEVHAVGLNPVDAKQIVGDKLPYGWNTLRSSAHSLLVKNTRVGIDFAGIVIGVNSKDGSGGGHPLPVGTRVFGAMPPLHGSAAEIVQAPMHQIAKAPENLELHEAAVLPLVSLTAWQALHPHIVSNQSSVLIVGGSGGSGHVALQMARALGARHITTVCSERSRDLVVSCGATHVVDYSKGEWVEDGTTGHLRNDAFVRQLQEAPGCPFDVILDCVTSADPDDAKFNYPATIQNPKNGLVASKDKSISASAGPDAEASESQAAPITTYLYQRLGGSSPDWFRATLDRPRILPRSLVWFPHSREQLFWIKFPHCAKQLDNFRRLAEDGKLVPHISKTIDGLSAANIQEGFDDILQRRVKGKIVVRVKTKDEQ